MSTQRLPSAPPLEVEFLDLLVMIERHRQPNGYMDASWYVLRRADAFRKALGIVSDYASLTSGAFLDEIPGLEHAQLSAIARQFGVPNGQTTGYRVAYADAFRRYAVLYNLVDDRIVENPRVGFYIAAQVLRWETEAPLRAAMDSSAKLLCAFLNPFEKPLTEETLAAHGCPAEKEVMTERLRIQLEVFDLALDVLKERPDAFQFAREESLDPFQILLYFVTKSARFDAGDEVANDGLFEELRIYFLLIETAEDVPKAKARFLLDMAHGAGFRRLPPPRGALAPSARLLHLR